MLPFEVQNIGAKLKRVLNNMPSRHKSVENALALSKNQNAEILKALEQNKLILNFSGLGPSISRQGA